ncbi:MAG: KUP/HAK/KT family potassium transporter [Pseudomonadota bacterium]
MAQAQADAPPSKPAKSAIEKHARDDAGAFRHGGFWTLLAGAIGVVFGDIGTSPLYALRLSLQHIAPNGAPAPADVIGIVSLILWALMLIVTLKYVLLLMRLDNKGEGGTLALMALAQRALGRRTAFIFLMGVLGAALFYGDALITPAISVLSAVEGLNAVPVIGAHMTRPLIIFISIIILCGLFFFQSRGTGQVGAWFGPIMVVWFLVIGGLGFWHLRESPEILAALSPLPGVRFIVTHGAMAFGVLGLVFLAVTGAEALYADMGHFGRRPVQRAWLFLVLPALALNYLGQGAYVLHHPLSDSLFFDTAPGMFRLPLVILATMATIIASQAVITGAYSLTQQAIQLGFLPRLEIRRTSETQAGQIYMPQVNWLVLAGVIVLMLVFETSDHLGSAYGIAVSGQMVVSSLLAFVAIWKILKQPPWVAAIVCTPFVIIESVFLSSNMTKLFEGGFVPLALALGLVLIMWTWARGSRIWLKPSAAMNRWRNCSRRCRTIPRTACAAPRSS